jgi:uncharacterized protein
MATTSKAGGSNAVLAFLRRATSYPYKPGTVDVVETHISWVFLTDQYAYKLKKPVTLDFVDFSTPSLRRRFCEDELRLNRRLAPEVYLDVLPVTQDIRGELELAGDGVVVDWVVRMKRLPADKAVDVLLRSRRLSLNEAAAIAQHLAKLYAGLPPAALTADKYRMVLDRHIRANEAALLEALPSIEKARIQRIHGAQLQFLNTRGNVFDHRVDSGRIVDGHGDLRPEHIYLTTPLTIIDCIEFSPELRQVDIADELSFLAMECDRLGDCSFGELALETYQRLGDDEIPPKLLAFYRCYRACVRAKVNGIRAEQLSESESRRQRRLVRQYLNWSDHYAAAIGKPTMIVVGGLMGTGKSTLAARLADLFGAELVSTDQIRRAMLGASPSPAGYAEGYYQPATRERVYADLIAQTEKSLCRGRSVILDGTFLTYGRRNLAYLLGKRHNAATIFALCHCPRETALSRIQGRLQDRASESEARSDLYDLQRSEFQSPDDAEPIVQIDSIQAISNQTRLICKRLHQEMAG